jgi:hypothetical protein
VPDAEVPQLLERAAMLVSGNELGPWPPSAEATQEVARKIAEIGRGVVIVSGLQRRAGRGAGHPLRAAVCDADGAALGGERLPVLEGRARGGRARLPRGGARLSRGRAVEQSGGQGGAGGGGGSCARGSPGCRGRREGRAPRRGSFLACCLHRDVSGARV